jgi:hypothetical protein
LLLAVALSLFAAQSARIKPGMVNTMTTATVAPRPTLPSLFGMTLNEAQRTLEIIRVSCKPVGPENGMVVGQDPQAGSDSYGSVIVIQTGRAPRLVLSGPSAPMYVDSDLTFTASFDPPLPPATPVTYLFEWDDGTPPQPGDQASVTHRFSTPGRHEVRVGTVVNDRLKINDQLPIDVAAVPVTDTTPTQNPVTDTRPARNPVTDTTSTGKGVLQQLLSNPAVLLLIGVAALLLFLRSMIRRPRTPEREPARSIAASPVASLAINGGIKSMEHKIEHPEKVRTGLMVRLRGGLRA